MVDYHIKRLGHRGDGVTEEGYFAPLTLPQERISAEAEGKSLSNVKILEPSEHRVKPPCPHFKSCGGCALQHASDGFVANWKVDVVREALAAHGIETELRPCLTSPTQSRRRASFSARRTKKDALAGFHARGSDVVIDIEHCVLIRPELRAALGLVKALAMTGASRKGEISVQINTSEAGLDVEVRGGKPLDPALQISLAQAAEQFSLARLSWEDDVIALRAPPIQRFGRARVVPPPGAFLQATKEGEGALLHHVQTIVADARSIVDLFSGCGTFSLPLAETKEVHAVEGEKAMVQAMDAGWRKAEGLKKLTHEARDLYRRPLLVDELKRFDAAVIDPPRTGAEAQFRELAKSGIKTIAYVSCNPVSFARDGAILRDAGYNLAFVQTVDQFRWASHVELVGAFVKN